MAISPVRAISTMPNGRTMRSNASILSHVPVTSAINLALAGAYYLNGSWKKARMSVQQYAETDECTEEALATREPGGALNPAG